MSHTEIEEPLLMLLQEHPEIHIDLANDQRWSFRHDDNVDPPDDEYWACGGYSTKREAIIKAFEAYGIDVDKHVNVREILMKYSITVGVDVPAFADIVVEADSLPKAMTLAEGRAKELGGRDFVPAVDEWQARLRVVSVDLCARSAPAEFDDQVRGILLRNERTDMEQKAYEILLEILNDSRSADYLPHAITERIKAAVIDLEAQEVLGTPGQTRNWDFICDVPVPADMVGPEP